MATPLDAEAMIRLEYKMDLLLTELADLKQGNFPPISKATCPICKQAVRFFFTLDEKSGNNTANRACGCQSGFNTSLTGATT